MSEFDSFLFSVVECRICHDHLKPPIWTCLKGHNLCSRYSESLQCPICSSQLAGRNLQLELIISQLIQLLQSLPPRNTRTPPKALLEPEYKTRNALALRIKDILKDNKIPLMNEAVLAIVNNLKYVCPFQANGCEKILTLHEDQHCEVCIFKPIDCPLSEYKKTCTWKGSIYELRGHLTEHHQHVHVVNTSNICLSMFFNTGYIYVLSISPKIQFCLSLGTDGNKIIYRIQLLGPNECLNFRCESIFVFEGGRKVHMEIIPSGKWRIFQGGELKPRENECFFSLVLSIKPPVD